MKLDTIVTAGGLISGAFSELAGTSIKALITLQERSLLERTVSALRESGIVGRIVIVAPEEVKNNPSVNQIDDFIPAHASGIENITRGLLHFKNEKRVILCSSDLPFVSPSSVRDFIARCPDDAAICYPVFEKEEIAPEIRAGIPSYIKLKEGYFTGGSIFRLDVGVCLARISEIGRSFDARKSACGMAGLLGFNVLMRFLFGICSIEDLKKRVEKMMSARCAIVRGCDPVVTFDIDDLTSYHFALAYLQGGAKGDAR